MFEEEIAYIIKVLKNETFQIIIFILCVLVLTVYFTLFHQRKQKVNKNHEVNVYYKGDKIASKDITL